MKSICSQNWEAEFLLVFGDHLVAIGFVISFSPYALELILSIFFISLVIFKQINRYYFNINMKNTKQCNFVVKSGLRIINLAILLCSMVGLGRTIVSNEGNC